MGSYCYNCMNEIRDGESCGHCDGGFESSAHHLKPGQILNGKYLVGNCIGEGGFGITYIGRDMVLDIRVAIKEFFPNGYVNRNNSVTQNVTATTQSQKDFFEKGKSRFLDEAKNIAKFIGEPGIVDVREYFETNGTAYIIMEYLDGVNLSRYVKQKGTIKPEVMFRLMLPIISSMKRVHEAGIIHRDISPDNIMLLKNGTLKLMDFGSARYFTNEEKEMSVMLKKGYSPEEQYRKNGHQGPWTDVYGLCATIYRCITGIVPDDSLDRLRQDSVKKPSEIGISISAPLENVLMYGFAVLKENRCKDMLQLYNLINKALNNQMPDIPLYGVVSDQMYNNNAYKTKSVTYGDDYSGVADDSYFRQSVIPVMPNKKSSKAPLIVLLIILILAIAGVGVYFIIGYINRNEKDAEPVQETQQVETLSETDSPTEPETEPETDPPTDPPTDPETAPPTDPPTDPPQQSDIVNVYDESHIYFYSASASSVLPDQKKYNYSAKNVLINDSTCWTENAKGVGVGEWIRLDLPSEEYVSGLKIINGYAGTETQYNNNAKITDIEIEFSNGQKANATLDVKSTQDRKDIQTLEFSQPVLTSYIRITILGAENAKYSDTCLTYVCPY